MGLTGFSKSNLRHYCLSMSTRMRIQTSRSGFCSAYLSSQDSMSYTYQRTRASKSTSSCVRFRKAHSPTCRRCALQNAQLLQRLSSRYRQSSRTASSPCLDSMWVDHWASPISYDCSPSQLLWTVSNTSTSADVPWMRLHLQSCSVTRPCWSDLKC